MVVVAAAAEEVLAVVVAVKDVVEVVAAVKDVVEVVAAVKDVVEVVAAVKDFRAHSALIRGSQTTQHRLPLFGGLMDSHIAMGRWLKNL